MHKLTCTVCTVCTLYWGPEYQIQYSALTSNVFRMTVAVDESITLIRKFCLHLCTFHKTGIEERFLVQLWIKGQKFGHSIVNFSGNNAGILTKKITCIQVVGIWVILNWWGSGEFNLWLSNYGWFKTECDTEQRSLILDWAWLK